MKRLLFNKIGNGFEDMVEIRRYLHRHPELSFQEKKTAEFIVDYYNKLGIPVRSKVGGNGIVARIKGGRPGKRVALRADFDALPIQDEKDVSYKSTVPGVMHACGHDGHTAMLLQLAKSIYEIHQELPGEYVFIHQHAEEVAPGGAKAMIEDGCLEGVDVIFATHLWSLTEIGTVECSPGPALAANDKFEIFVQGKGGHGAYPHLTKDAVVIGAKIVNDLQTIVARRIDPLHPSVISVGSITAGNAFNIIADNAKLEGTVRTFDQDTQVLIEGEIKRIIEGVALSNGCQINCNYVQGYPPVINNTKVARFINKVLEYVPDIKKVSEPKPHMGSEDFSYYLQHVPGAFFFTGAKPHRPYPHHHPKFDFDEQALLIGAKALGTVAISIHSEKVNLS